MIISHMTLMILVSSVGRRIRSADFAETDRYLTLISILSRIAARDSRWPFRGVMPFPVDHSNLRHLQAILVQLIYIEDSALSPPEPEPGLASSEVRLITAIQGCHAKRRNMPLPKQMKIAISSGSHLRPQ